MSTTITFLPVTETAKSSDGGTGTQFTLTNTSSQTLYVYWIDRAGMEQQYGELAPGATYRQAQTWSTHAWEVKSKDGSIGFKFFPTVPGAITVSGADAPAFLDFSERVTHTPLGDWSTAEGYGVINAAKSLGVPDLGFTLPVNGQNNNLALDVISASSAWAAGYTGKGVKVAVLDGGIASSLETNGSLAGGYDIFDNDSDPSPDNGAYRDHALGAASIMVASHASHPGQDTMGVAPDAQLYNVRIASSTGSNGSKIADGIHWAVDHGIKVISLPQGNAALQPDTLISDAVHYAFTHNVVVVIAGGNESIYGASGPALSARSGEAIAVGNLDALGALPFASSNTPGATPFPWVMASSSGFVPNPDGGYTYHQDGGTSFAGPYVAGLAALLFQQNPSASAAEIIAKILGGATISTSPATAAAGGSHLAGTALADRLLASAGNDTIDGGAGLDSVVFLGARANYTIERHGNTVLVTDKTGADGVDTLSNVERLVFQDKSLALDIDGSGGQVYRVYQAAFGRVPDEGGLGYWLGAKDNGMALADIAAQFMGSSEARGLYGANPSNEALVNAVYQNVLHRAPDQAGHDFWVDTMSRGLNTVSSLVLAFSDSPENIASLVGVIGNGFTYTPYHG
jgi:subtilisin family serine protease